MWTNIKKNKLQKIILYLIVFGSLCLQSCKSTQQPAQPMEKYEEIEAVYSTLNIPLDISINTLERIINEQIGEVLYEDYKMSDDNLIVKVQRTQNVDLKLEGQAFAYVVPVQLLVIKQTALGNISGDGELKLEFKSQFEIGEDWNLHTETSVVAHEWIQKPVLKMGIVKLPIRYIADKILDRTKNDLCKTIDEQLQKSIALRQMIDDAWTQLQDPILMSEAYKTWIKIRPKAISMTPLQSYNDTIRSTIHVDAFSEIVVGEKPKSEKIDTLPAFQMAMHANEDFIVNLTTAISYKEAERHAKDYILGQTFSQGNQSVTVEDIELYGQDDKLVVNAKLSGSYKGSIYMTGKPFFDKNTNTIEIQNLDFELNTRNFLYKSAAWLFRKGITKQFQKQLKFPLDENLQQVRQMVEQQLAHYPISADAYLEGTLEDFAIDRTYLTPDDIQVVIISKGKLNVRVGDFAAE